MASDKDFRAKILVVGPLKCGKTTISSYVADTAESAGREYRPTKGVRILELESSDLKIREHAEKIIELWDCSGDPRYEKCWPALRLGVRGVVLVVDPERSTSDDLLFWYNEFVVKIGLLPEHVMVLLHHTSESTNDSAIADFRLPSQMSGIHTIPSNIDHEGEALKNDFNIFMVKLFGDASLM